MRKYIGWIAASAVIFSLAATAYAAISADDVVGLWYTEGKSARVEVTKDVSGKYSGKIVWLKEPNYAEGEPDAGKPKTDRNNPDEAKRNTPIVGLNMVAGFTFDGESWSGGTIYDPESGKTYKCVMTLDGKDTLNVRGYVGVPAFGKTTVWTRVPKEEAEKKEDAPETAKPN